MKSTAHYLTFDRPKRNLELVMTSRNGFSAYWDVHDRVIFGGVVVEEAEPEEDTTDADTPAGPSRSGVPAASCVQIAIETRVLPVDAGNALEPE